MRGFFGGFLGCRTEGRDGFRIKSSEDYRQTRSAGDRMVKYRIDSPDDGIDIEVAEKGEPIRDPEGLPDVPGGSSCPTQAYRMLQSLHV